MVRLGVGRAWRRQGGEEGKGDRGRETARDERQRERMEEEGRRRKMASEEEIESRRTR